MRRTRKFFNDLLKSRHFLIVLIIICLTLILATFTRENSQGPLYTIAGTVITPFQNGVNRVGDALMNWASGFKNVQKLNTENEELRAKIEELTDALRAAGTYRSQLETKENESALRLSQEYGQYLGKSHMNDTDIERIHEMITSGAAASIVDAVAKIDHPESASAT